MGKVLVVDDEKSIRLTLSAFLKRVGYDVRAAETVHDVWALGTDWVPDVAVLDLLIGCDDGLDLARSLLKSYPSMQIILMTGQPDVDSAREALRLHIYDYVSKPVGRERIVEVVSGAMRAKAERDEYARLQLQEASRRDERERFVAERTAESSRSDP